MSTPEAFDLYSGNTAFIEELYERYLEDPAGVADEWRRYFDALQREPAPAESAVSVPAREPAAALEIEQSPAPEAAIAVNTDNKNRRRYYN